MATKKTDQTKTQKVSSAKGGASAPLSSDTSKQATGKKTSSAKTPDKKPATRKPRGKTGGVRGRPKDSPDIWTPEHIDDIAEKLFAYIEKTPCPSFAEFCFLNLVRRQRLYEFEEFEELRNLLHAKREAFYEKAGQRITKAQGSRGAFICKALANVGEYSWTEKSETKGTLNSTQVSVYIPDNNRGDGPAKDGQE